MMNKQKREQYIEDNLDEYEHKIFYSNLRQKLQEIEDSEHRKRADDMRKTGERYV